MTHDIPDDIEKIADNLALMRLVDENAALQAKVERYEAALKWYADSDNYDDEHAPFRKCLWGEAYDNGTKARQALQETP